MTWTELHAEILGKAFANVLGTPESGSVAFVRCLTPNVVHALARDTSFGLQEWVVARVANRNNEGERTISADHAVERREAKGDAMLLLVDTLEAGAGMDGIYSAAREVVEAELFEEALRLSKGEVTRQLSREDWHYAEHAIRKARGRGRYSVSAWTEFDFLCRIAADKRHPGAYLHLLGLWPVLSSEEADVTDELDASRLFVDRLLGAQVAGLTPSKRVEGLRLLQSSERQCRDLERFLRSADTKPLLPALADLVAQKHLWVNALRREGAAQAIQSIELLSWRTRAGKIAKWSGLREGDGPNEPPVLTLDPEARQARDYSQLAVKWKARPANLEKGAAEYRVFITTDMDEELATREVTHSAKSGENCKFNNDDFSDLGEDALISARVIVSVIGDSQIESQESEEFIIRFGEPPEQEQGGVGRKVRAFSEGLIELNSRETVSDLVSESVSSQSPLRVDSKGFVLLRTPQRGKSFQVFQPSLIAEVEKQWAEQEGAIGRWAVPVRASGSQAGAAKFQAFAPPESTTEWDRVRAANRRMTARFVANGGGVGQVYDEKSQTFNAVREYLLAWTALLEKGDQRLALANTVEVQSLSGRTIGLIVLPSHPLRIAWQVAYDNLVLHARFDQGMQPKEIREEFSTLDGAMFPVFLPGLQPGNSFVFADTLGFHAVGMVPDNDKEPKAAVAILARALGESENADAAPTISRQSAEVLGDEIARYLECHKRSKLLHIHALRAGDGLTVARSLGHVQKRYRKAEDEEDQDEYPPETTPAFVLEFYPSLEQRERGIAGRFIAEAREKRRSGAGVVSLDDSWMLESLNLPGEVRLPRLRWARKDVEDPDTAAHLAIAFDTLESRIVSEEGTSASRPFYAYGLVTFFERVYASHPAPTWRSAIPPSKVGERHPSDRTHTDRLMRLQDATYRSVARNIGDEGTQPTLKTEISTAKAQSLQKLHQLCDWVINVDRNAGIEYFDSPRENEEIYNAYIIDCVPERDDLGCLQLITSTSNQDDVFDLLTGALDQMGLGHSRWNVEDLLSHLKALSGRLAIRLTGQIAPGSDLISLAICHANCQLVSVSSDCWVSLEDGFFVPIDDVRDLLAPLNVNAGDGEEKETRPGLIYVSATPRKGLCFQFIEVNYRRHLRAARAPGLLDGLHRRVESLRSGWSDWLDHEGISPSFLAIRRAKLARVLRFYADRARRHHLPEKQYETIIREIDRMIGKGMSYAFAKMPDGNRGWIFCPEYAATNPLKISPTESNTQIFLFGPESLPNSDSPRESIAPPPEERVKEPALLSQGWRDESQNPVDERLEIVEKVTSDLNESHTVRFASSSEDGESDGDKVPSICFGTEVYGGNEVHWPLTTKGNPHLMLAGLPGMGKTTCLLNLCRQMVTAGVRPIIFSYHQDIDERLEKIVDSVRYIDCYGLGFNPLQVMDRSSRLAYLDVAGAVRDIFTSIFPELGDIQGERIRRAIKDSFVETGWDSPNADLANLREPEFKRFLEILKADPKPDRGLRTLLARLEELEDYGFFELAETRGSLWESDQPIVIRIHTTQNDNLQKAFASLIFYGLYKDMFRRGVQDHITHAVIFDEAHRAAGLKLIPTMAKECRKFGISLVLASQEAKDFDSSLFSAIANYLVLRLTEADAKSLVRKVGSSQQERDLIDRIKQMDRFRAIYFSEGKKRPSTVGLLQVED